MLFYDRLDRFFGEFCATVAVAGGLGLIFAILVTCISIILKMTRRALDTTFGLANSEAWAFIRPILGEEELVQYGVGFALFAALPWVMYQKGHVKIDLFERYLTPRVNQILDLLGDIAFAALAYLILTRQWFQIFRKARRKEEPMSDLIFSGEPLSALDRLRDGQESQILGIKLWPLYTVAEILTFVFLLVALFCVYRSARVLATQTAPKTG